MTTHQLKFNDVDAVLTSTTLHKTNHDTVKTLVLYSGVTKTWDIVTIVHNNKKYKMLASKYEKLLEEHILKAAMFA